MQAVAIYNYGISTNRTRSVLVYLLFLFSTAECENTVTHVIYLLMPSPSSGQADILQQFFVWPDSILLLNVRGEFCF